MTDTIQEGVRAGSFDVEDPAVTARALLGMIQAIATWFRSDGPSSPEGIAGTYVQFALSLLRETSSAESDPT